MRYLFLNGDSPIKDVALEQGITPEGVKFFFRFYPSVFGKRIEYVRRKNFKGLAKVTIIFLKQKAMYFVEKRLKKEGLI